jgi:hypothetical protein
MARSARPVARASLGRVTVTNSCGRCPWSVGTPCRSRWAHNWRSPSTRRCPAVWSSCFESGLLIPYSTVFNNVR